jgi:hypothetical protein
LGDGKTSRRCVRMGSVDPSSKPATSRR